MKLIQTIREEIVPLSRKQGVIVLIIIACVFQFVLFYAPALAADSVKTAKASSNDDDLLIANEIMVKDGVIPANVPILTDTELTPAEKIITKTEVSQASTTVEYIVVSTSTHVMTAYNSEPGQTDNSPCITANGFNVCEHGEEDTIAANFLKFGTKVRIPELFGDRVFVVRDRMNKRHADRVDIWMNNRSDAIKFGIKTAKIEVLK
ncbi:MAG: 3D domain-containing protein [Candidatus Falkowbacteria bacterium]|nr:MAG: 3D domain-containing protein [Candidatus Falkowbacteria bacterium]